MGHFKVDKSVITVFYKSVTGSILSFYLVEERTVKKETIIYESRHNN